MKAAVSTEPGSNREALGHAWHSGQLAAQRAIAHALRDDSDLVWDPRQRPASAPGSWRAAPPLHAYDPLEPLAASWATRVLKDGGEVQPPPPVAYDAPEYWRETEEVLAVSRALTAEQRRIAEDWNLDRGSITPARGMEPQGPGPDHRRPSGYVAGRARPRRPQRRAGGCPQRRL
jgi:hypothetical protein